MLNITSTNLDDCPVGAGCAVDTPTTDIVGTYDGPANTGFSVNGVAGYANGGRFIVPNVPVNGTMIITATTLAGQTATAAGQLVAEGTSTLMIPDNKVAFAPAAINFSFDASLVNPPAGTTIEISFGTPNENNGAGYIGASLAATGAPTSFTYSTPGLYGYSISVTNSQGTVTDVGQMLVQDSAAQRGT